MDVTPVLGPSNNVARVLQRLTYADLDGWLNDEHGEAWSALERTRSDLAPTENLREALEAKFSPIIISDREPCLVTGYHEPCLYASPVKTQEFSAPIYSLPESWDKNGSHPTRQQIISDQLYAGNEIAWLRDEVAAFFLQVQGSGRLQYPSGQIVRVGFAGKTNHPYRSIGQELARRGVFDAPEMTANAIKSWLRQNPSRQNWLYHNPGFVFFKKLDNLHLDLGPIGTAGVPLTPMRSIAVDPSFIALGTPVWLEVGDYRHLTVAQDTGSAIRGAQRADLFCGWSEKAAELASGMKLSGRLVALLPNQELK